MKIKFILSSIMLVSGFSSVGYSSSSDMIGIHAEASGMQNKAMDINKLPQSGEGVKIVDDSEIYHLKLSKEEQLSFGNEKKLGYVKRKSPDAIQLLQMGKHTFQSPEDKIFYNSSEPYDTHLKKSITQIQLAFYFKPLSFITPENTLGFAPAMTWKNGWTGIAQYFKYESVGVCSYLKTSVNLNGSAIRLSKERISYYIHNKPVVAINEGRQKEGFSYIINWYDNDYFHRLSCATSEYSQDVGKNTKSLAILIDKE